MDAASAVLPISPQRPAGARPNNSPAHGYYGPPVVMDGLNRPPQQPYPSSPPYPNSTHNTTPTRAPTLTVTPSFPPAYSADSSSISSSGYGSYPMLVGIPTFTDSPTGPTFARPPPPVHAHPTSPSGTHSSSTSVAGSSYAASNGGPSSSSTMGTPVPTVMSPVAETPVDNHHQHTQRYSPPVSSPMSSPLANVVPLQAGLAGAQTPSVTSVASSSPQPPAPAPTTEARPWVHDARRLYFLPPYISTPAPTSLNLINDSLETVKDYREFVDTVGRLEAEYGRALSAAARKLEQKLEAVHTAPPGGRKPPGPTLAKAMRGHLSQVQNAARLHTKRPEALSDQLVKPLASLERRGGESARRLGMWGKDVRARWDAGRERVDAARTKYHAAVREHEMVQSRLRTYPAPSGGAASKADTEWIKLEKAVADAEATRADRKHAYLVVLAGEGENGGGGRDLTEGGGETGWGEEARALYGLVQNTMLELLKHHAAEDKSNAVLVRNVYERAERCFDTVDVGADENAFLDWNTTNPQSSGGLAEVRRNSASDEPSSPLSTLAPPGADDAVSTSSHGSGRIAHRVSQSLSLSPSTGGGHLSLTCPTFVPPPSVKSEQPTFRTDKRTERNWLINRWSQSAEVLASIEGEDGNSGMLAIKRNEFIGVCKLCDTYSANRGLGNPEEVWERRLALLREMGEDERRAAVARAEMACLEEVLGPNPAPDMGHDFKDKQFAISAPCDVCGQSVWAPIKPEMACRSCGIALHRHCALHVGPECSGLKTAGKRRGHPNSKIRRSITSGANILRRRSAYDSPHGAAQEYRPSQPSRLEPLRDEEVQVSPFVAGIDDLDRPAVVAALLDEGPTDESQIFTFARAQHPYTADGPLELSLARGDIVRIIEPDLDGSGWIKVRRGLNPPAEQGLVPESFLGLVGVSTPPQDGGVGKFAVALFDFPPPAHQLGHGEIRVKQHELYELSDEGMAFDELWCELVVAPEDGEGMGGRVRGVVPKTYVKPVE